MTVANYHSECKCNQLLDDDDEKEEVEGSIHGGRSVTLHSSSLPPAIGKKPPRNWKTSKLSKETRDKRNMRKKSIASNHKNISGLVCLGQSSKLDILVQKYCNCTAPHRVVVKPYLLNGCKVQNSSKIEIVAIQYTIQLYFKLE